MMLATLMLIAATQVRFANGVTVELSTANEWLMVKARGRHFSEIKVRRKGRPSETLSLSHYLKSRIEAPVPGDKTSNDLKWEYSHGSILPLLFQLVPTSKSRGWGVIGFSRTHFSQPNDMVQDLVAIDVASRPKIVFVRTIGVPADYGTTPTFPRLFHSKGELLLRTATGFEVLDATGKPKSKFNIANSGRMIGQAKSALVFGDNSTTNPAVTFFDLATRAIKTVKIPLPKGQVTSVDFQRSDNPNTCNVSMAVNVSPTRFAYARYVIDFSARTVRGPVMKSH